MKFSMVNGVRREPEKSLRGYCLSCGAEMISKCGSKKIHHWAHKGRVECDPWWENETEWHRNWKDLFPLDWQEVVQYAENGEKHIADIKTNQDWVIEFQHSFLSKEERKSRNEFYKSLVWIMDGKRLKGDEEKLKSQLISVPESDEFFRLRAWRNNFIKQYSDENSLTILDFGESVLWIILPKISDHFIYVKVCTKSNFLDFFRIDIKEEYQKFELIIEGWINNAIEYNNAMETAWREKTDKMHIDIRTKKGFRFI